MPVTSSKVFVNGKWVNEETYQTAEHIKSAENVARNEAACEHIRNSSCYYELRQARLEILMNTTEFDRVAKRGLRPIVGVVLFDPHLPRDSPPQAVYPFKLTPKDLFRMVNAHRGPEWMAYQWRTMTDGKIHHLRLHRRWIELAAVIANEQKIQLEKGWIAIRDDQKPKEEEEEETSSDSDSEKEDGADDSDDEYDTAPEDF